VNSFKEVLVYLDSLINYEVEFPLGGSRDRPKLELVFEAARQLKLPLELSHCLHIAGTVGKGSVAAMCQALLTTNHSALTFTSPHLVSPKERVQLDGRDLPDELWCEGIAAVRDAATKLTYFETIFAFYLWCAQRLGTTAHVVETGLGGSFDATNVLIKTTAILTRIDFDHTHILGKTLGAIAADKSGIIKQGMNCFSVWQAEEAAVEIEHAVARKEAKLFLEGRDFALIEDFMIPMPGEFQNHNLSVAVAAVRSLDSGLSDDDVRNSLSGLKVMGRQQDLVSHPNVMLDVCHNPASFAALAESLRLETKIAKRIALVAMMKDKDARESLRQLTGVIDELWVTSAPTPRTYTADALANIGAELGFRVRVVERATAYEEILALPETSRSVICGSFYLVGDFLKEHPDA